MIDLTPDQLRLVKGILAEVVPGREVRAFGSRVRGETKPYSDLDLAVMPGGEPSPADWLMQLKEAFEESDLPFSVDVLDWARLSKEFRKIIEREYEVIQEAGSGSGESGGGGVCSMSEWSEKTLADLGHFARGKSKHRPRDAAHLYGGPYPFIQTGDVKASNHFITEFTQTYSEAGLAQSKLWSAGTLCITIAANIAETGILTFPGCFPDSVIGFSADPAKSDVHFVEYLLQFFRRRVQKQAIGSVQDNINLGTFQRFRFNVPAKEEQCRIAEVLLSLDEKIELNRKQNRTLEAIAQALFKRWFVEFEFPDENGRPYKYSGGAMQPSELGEIPVGWEVGTFGDEFEIVMGQSPAGDTYNETGDGMVFFQGRTDFGFRFPNIRIYCTDPKKQASKGNVLLSVRAPVGDLNIAFEDCCIGRGLAAIKSRYKSYVYYKMKHFRPIFQVFESEGTVFGSISKAGFENIDAIIPPETIAEQYNELVEPLDNKIESLTSEIRTLSQLRNTLLPKLLSGELRVPYTECATENAI